MARRHKVALRQIKPGKPNQDAYVKLFNGRPPHVCVSEHWFVSLAHIQATINGSVCEYNE